VNAAWTVISMLLAACDCYAPSFFACIDLATRSRYHRDRKQPP